MTGIPKRLERCAKVFSGPRDPAGKSELARRAGIPLRTLNTYFAGRKLPLDRAAAIAKAAGKSLMWLATGEGEEQAHDLPVRSLRERPDSTMTPAPGLAELQAAFGPAPAVSYDQDLLRACVRELESGLLERELALNPVQKAGAVNMLFAASIPAGEVNAGVLADILAFIRSPA